MHIDELDTPVMLVDLDKLEDNIVRLQRDLERLGLQNRPHIKTHKIPAIGWKQLDAGAIGITCQKLGEAEVFAAAGFKDILVPYNIVGRSKVERLVQLTYQARMTAALDSEVTARGISEVARREGATVPVVIELDSGGHRAGVQSPEEAQSLARRVSDLPGLSFQGLMCYPSRPPMADTFARTRELLERDGIPVRIISGGGTGAQEVSAATGCTEHRSGTYIYNDVSVLRSGRCTVEQCAMSVAVTVVSTAYPGKATIDGGSKTFTNDAVSPDRPNGDCVEHPGIFLERMNEEHGILNTEWFQGRLTVGQRLSIVPLHACGTTNLHDYVAAHRHGTVVALWPVAARGKIR
jgi:D-serine deaminase-like pyridoxal phosphate-dependent protein